MHDVIRSVELSSTSISTQTRTVVDVLRNIEKRLPGIGDRFSCAEERMPAVEECRAGVERREQSLEDSDLSSSCYLSKQMDGGQSRCSSLSPAMRDADGLQHRVE